MGRTSRSARALQSPPTNSTHTTGAVPSKEYMDTSSGPAIDKEEPPPFLGSWRRIYIAIVIYLVTVIALFGLFTRSLNR